ncbi:MAG: DNA cytosine methyltransferase [Actinomycetota bacterium]|nr:DNA cytosine methyltransferase [Actinomycetota bacterium]MDQ6944791.1 DNA cytosine methyltransferase [Actinomycetota bacterium]
MVALLTRRGTTVDAQDWFAGWGGSSQGIHAAGAELTLAANHDQLAIDTHSANWPKVDHRRVDLVDPDSGDYLDPVDLPPTVFLWASPSCKFHSPANAKKLYAQGPQAMLWDDEDFDEAAYANSERSRVTMCCPLRYAARHHPEVVVIENVVEATKWGPGRDGSTFRWWLNEWTKCGYDYQVLFLNSMFFAPCPQSRDRLYVVFWRRGNRRPDLDYRPVAYCGSQRCGGVIVHAVQSFKTPGPTWPLPQWGKYREQYTYRCPHCHANVEPAAWPAYSAIDWTRLGPTLGERDRPLAASTVERIRRGLMKFRNSPPIVIPAKAAWGSDRDVTWPFTTQTTEQDKALVLNGTMAALRNGTAPAALAEQMATLVGQGHHGLAYTPFMPSGHNNDSVRAVIDPLFTTVASGRHNCVAGEWAAPTPVGFGFAHTPQLAEMRGGGSVHSGQHSVAQPMHTVTAGGLHHGLASTAMFSKINGGPGDTAWHHPNDQLGTLTSRDTTGLVTTSDGALVLPWVDQWRSDPIAVSEQLATVMTHLRHALATIEVDDTPISDEDLQRVRFRMLEPDPELRNGMAFAPDYILLGSKTQKTDGLGNAVTPPVATWVTGQCLATLGG